MELPDLDAAMPVLEIETPADHREVAVGLQGLLCAMNFVEKDLLVRDEDTLLKTSLGHFLQIFVWQNGVFKSTYL
jgi:hypothetical protein